MRYVGSSANLETRELDMPAVAPGADSSVYLIRARNLKVYIVERIFRTIGVRFARVNGFGMEDHDPEAAVNFQIAGVDRAFAESIAHLIENLTHATVLIAECRAEDVAGSK